MERIQAVCLEACLNSAELHRLCCVNTQDLTQRGVKNSPRQGSRRGWRRDSSRAARHFYNKKETELHWRNIRREGLSLSRSHCGVYERLPRERKLIGSSPSLHLWIQQVPAVNPGRGPALHCSSSWSKRAVPPGGGEREGGVTAVDGISSISCIPHRHRANAARPAGVFSGESDCLPIIHLASPAREGRALRHVATPQGEKHFLALCFLSSHLSSSPFCSASTMAGANSCCGFHKWQLH